VSVVDEGKAVDHDIAGSEGPGVEDAGSGPGPADHSGGGSKPPLDQGRGFGNNILQHLWIRVGALVITFYISPGSG